MPDQKNLCDTCERSNLKPHCGGAVIMYGQTLSTGEANGKTLEELSRVINCNLHEANIST